MLKFYERYLFLLFYVKNPRDYLLFEAIANYHVSQKLTDTRGSLERTNENDYCLSPRKSHSMIFSKYTFE